MLVSDTTICFPQIQKTAAWFISTAHCIRTQDFGVTGTGLIGRWVCPPVWRGYFQSMAHDEILGSLMQLGLSSGFEVHINLSLVLTFQ